MLAKIFASEHYKSHYSCQWCTLNDSISEMRLALCILARRLAPSALVPNLQSAHVLITFYHNGYALKILTAMNCFSISREKMLNSMAFKLSVKIYLSRVSFFYVSAWLKMCSHVVCTVYHYEPKYIDKIQSSLTLRKSILVLF